MWDCVFLLISRNRYYFIRSNITEGIIKSSRSIRITADLEGEVFHESKACLRVAVKCEASLSVGHVAAFDNVVAMVTKLV